jgi:hypothetical protein
MIWGQDNEENSLKKENAAKKPPVVPKELDFVVVVVDKEESANTDKIGFLFKGNITERDDVD